MCLILLTCCSKNNGLNESIHIGSKSFTEGVIVSEIAAELLLAHGQKVTRHFELGGTRFLWDALLNGDIDVYPEYSGTIKEEILKKEFDQAPNLPLSEALKKYGISASTPLGFSNSYALGMKRSTAKRLHIETISDLINHPNLRVGISNEMLDRGDGYKALASDYGLRFKNVKGMAHALSYKGLEQNAVDVIDVYTTDPEIQMFDIKILEDDRNFFKKYNGIYLVRSDSSKTILPILDKLKNRIDNADMIAMNKQALIDKMPPNKIAASFLNKNFNFNLSAKNSPLLQNFWERTKEHIELVGISMMLAMMIGFILGIVGAKNEKLGHAFLSITGVIQTIPTLALLVFMLPLFGIGSTSAIVALLLYSLLPIVRNTMLGFQQIKTDLLESARVIGLTHFSILWRIELPLSMRTILNGIKLALVMNIGMATLGALIGAGGYGQLILTGIRLNDTTLILQGAIPAALLALIAQGAFYFIDNLLVPKGIRLETN